MLAFVAHNVAFGSSYVQLHAFIFYLFSVIWSFFLACLKYWEALFLCNISVNVFKIATFRPSLLLMEFYSMYKLVWIIYWWLYFGFWSL